MKRNSSDVFPYFMGINGIGQIARLRRDVAEMKFKKSFPFFYKKFGHQVYEVFGHFLMGK